MIILFFQKSTFTHSLTNKLQLLPSPHAGGFALDPRPLPKCAIVMAICCGNLPWTPTDGSQVIPCDMWLIRHSYLEWQL